ncbi:ABC transporter permease [Paenibacillus gallinarum]|uniref:Transport permease protein n=1 Tax=Paenibacillus gallinarum TaxID=2762232 RepID=A0ABR8SZF5_9BACL|nr:ABC transporter permease [Paenibacillus gallinarum]MBD7968902.1 ABC transporter permease [Paenibacillus gallinarum]
MKSYLKELNGSKDLILRLSKSDFWTKYSNSYFGISWAFIQPIAILITYWFVFQIGFRVVPLNNVPYILWLICGLVPWFFFSEALSNATNSFLEYSYLVKKVVFKKSVIPSIKIISALYIHLCFLFFIVYLFFFYGFNPDVYNLQVIYYMLCMLILLISVTYITASIVVFFRDLNQIISIFLQFGVWLTPILWQPEMFPEKFHFFLKLNPMFYIVEGYRDSFFNSVWFWEKPLLSLYFWILTIMLFFIGTFVYKKLQKHFSDVL